MVLLAYSHGRSPQSAAVLGLASNIFPSLRPTLAKDCSASGFFRKICHTLNPSKFVKKPLPRSLPPEWCVFGYIHGRSPQSGAVLGLAPNIFPSLRPTLAKYYSVSGFSQKICSTLNPSKFVKTPLSSSLPPEWCVWAYSPGQSPQSGDVLGLASDIFPALRPTLAKDYSVSGFFRKMRTTLNPSKFVSKPFTK